MGLNNLLISLNVDSPESPNHEFWPSLADGRTPKATVAGPSFQSLLIL